MIISKLFSYIVTIFLSCILLAGSVSAAIYKTVDETGNIVFTDNAPTDQSVEEVKLRPLIPIPATQSIRQTPPPRSDKEAFKGYVKLEFIEPSPRATIHNQSHFNVRISLSPDLQSGHRVRLLLNGKRIGELTEQFNFTVSNVERGSQELTAEILDAKSKVLKSTNNTVYVHRAMVRPTPN
ncbi:MAG: DUF4124 domain-containing protein [Endozoicomonas sp.]